MARTAAIELVEHRIRVNIIIRAGSTPRRARTFDRGRDPGRRGQTPLEASRPTGGDRPRLVFLCDPASDYITGSTLSIEGGITLPWWTNRGSAIPE